MGFAPHTPGGLGPRSRPPWPPWPPTLSPGAVLLVDGPGPDDDGVSAKPVAFLGPRPSSCCGLPPGAERVRAAILSSMGHRPPKPPTQAALNNSHCLPMAKAHRSPSVHGQLIWPKRRGGCWIEGPRCPPFQSSAGLNGLVVAWLGNQHQLNLKKKQGAEPKPRLDWAGGAGCLPTAPGKPSSGATSFLAEGGTGTTEPL